MSPQIGVVVLLVLTVCLAAVIAVSAGAWSLESQNPTATFELTANSETSSVTIEHIAGDAIDVETLSITVTVNGTALAKQPPVPFVGANGFDGAPDGPFNERSESTWTAGERAGVSIAATNSPTLTAGDSVTVTLTIDGRWTTTLETTAR